MPKKASDITLDQELNAKSNKFMKKINSNMHYKSEFSGNFMNFDWIEEFELACPYIDNLVRNPKVALIKEQDVVKTEKAKKITVASVKDLAKNTHYIETVDEKTGDVQPSKILIERSEETFNTYENRILYTLIDNLTRFIMKQEKMLEDLEIKNEKCLEYVASTSVGNERIKIEMQMTSIEIPEGLDNKDLDKELEEIRKRIKRIKDFIQSWKQSEMVGALDKAHVPLVRPPLKKTNLILRNTNFQMAMRLWDFLQNYDDSEADENSDDFDTTGNDVLQGILDDSFLMDYFILDSISSSKKIQKDKLYKYAIVMMHQQIKRVISLLLEKGIKISDQEIIDIIANEIRNEKNKKGIDSNNEIKRKFQSAMDDYFKKTQDYF